MKTIVLGKDGLEKLAANIITDSINDLLKKQDKVVFAVPGGRSVAGIFSKLKNKKIPWEKVHIFMVDERLVPITDKGSNFLLVKDNLIDGIKIPKKNVHPFLVDKGIEQYEEELKKYGGRYDVVLLSSGEDGHVGALYPEHDSIEDESEYYLEMDDSPKPPPNRMTMSMNLLLKANVAVLLFIGESKKDAFEKFKDNNIGFELCPAKLVSMIKDSYVLTDLR